MSKKFFLSFLLIFIILCPSFILAIDPGSTSDFEKLGEDIARTFVNFLNERVEETLVVSNFDYSNMDLAKTQIKDFYDSKKSEIWFNIGSDVFPLEERQNISLYREIAFIDFAGQEIIKYSKDGFSDNLKDISISENTEFKSESYFLDTKNLQEGKVFIGELNTWYVSFQEVFMEASDETKVKQDYSNITGRDIMVQGDIKFSSPVYKKGIFLGIVVLSLDYRTFQELSKHIEPLNDNLVVSSSYSKNYLLVFDKDGNTIIHPKPDNIRGYLEDGKLAGYNEPNSTRLGNIFNLYKYVGSFAYSDMAKAVLENKENFISSATDVGGRTKITVAVPIMYDNSKTNYADLGVFGGIMMSIQLEDSFFQNVLGETPQNRSIYFIYFGTAIILLLFLFILVLSFKKDEYGNSIGLNKVLFGSVSKKLILSFSILIFILVLLLFVNYNIKLKINEDLHYIKNINFPLKVMVEQVRSYDGILTENVNFALLHFINGHSFEGEEYISKYSIYGEKLDDLLNIQAQNLINLSRRSFEEKNKIYVYLEDLKYINSNLVRLEKNSFELMREGKNDEAYNLIGGEEYHNYKEKLLLIYLNWDKEEQRIFNYYDQRIIKNFFILEIYSLGLGILFIIISIFSLFILSRKITFPLEELTLANQDLNLGNFDTKVNIQTGDEFQILGESFNKTIENLKNLDLERNQLDHAKTEFLSITSHELRSPMTPMRAQLQMLLKNYFGKLNSKQKESLEIVLRNTERLDKIIVDFLEISRIEAARLKFVFVKADLNDMATSIVDEMKGFMPEKNIKLIYSSKKLPIIEVDPDRVGQVLRNLINNALKFTPKGGKIIIETKVSNGQIFFSVKDSGIGIKKSDLERIFEPFYQAEQTIFREYSGTGLGLSICRGIIESQGGKIWVESEVDKGSTFSFSVPFKPVKEIQPIRLLFSPTFSLPTKIKSTFIKFLGPMGEKEFEMVKEDLSKKNLISYINFLSKNSILSKEDFIEFRIKILSEFGEKKNKIEINTLESLGLISSNDWKLKLKEIYTDYLGKSGEQKFIKLDKNYSLKSVLNSINELVRERKISLDTSEEFKNKVKQLLNKEKEIDKND